VTMNMVNQGRQIPKKRLQGIRVVGIESRGALGAEFARSLLKALGVACGQEDAGAFGAGTPSGFKPDAGATAYDDKGLTNQFRLAPGGDGSGRG
jgi:hypothetical protein